MELGLTDRLGWQSKWNHTVQLLHCAQSRGEQLINGEAAMSQHTSLVFDGVARASEDDVAVVVSFGLHQTGRVHTLSIVCCVSILK